MECAEKPKADKHVITMEDELVAGIIEGIEEYRAGLGKTFDSKEEFLKHLRSL